MLHRFGLAGSRAFFARGDRIAAVVDQTGSTFRVGMYAFSFGSLTWILASGGLQHVLHHGAQFFNLRLQAAPLPLVNVVLNFRFLLGAQR
ncbi:hypothetical protein ASD58_19470 [Duganella sp. Root1480D1]|nr:hypothetical protein ASD58_19470 [Duganella sp. Root1480D1]